jgi:hypothetical protein
MMEWNEGWRGISYEMRLGFQFYQHVIAGALDGGLQCKCGTSIMGMP